MATHRCAGCDQTWTALNACHCGGCHETFSGIWLFDWHRTAIGEHGSCVEPRNVVTGDDKPIMFFREGMWRGPEMTPEEKRRAESWG